MKRFCLISFLIILNIFSQSTAETPSVANELSSESSPDISSLALGKEEQKSNHPLPADQAFKLSAILLDNNMLAVRWLVQPDYYLYKDKISFSWVLKSITAEENFILANALAESIFFGAFSWTNVEISFR